MNSERPSLSIVVPAYNEAEALTETVRVIVDALADVSRTEIVLVNDGSDDSTLDVMQCLRCSSGARVVIVDRSENGGMGKALSSGFAAATGEVLTWIPGDGEYDLAEILPGVDMLNENDIVLVRRSMRDGVSRNAVSSIMYGLLRLLFRFDACGYCGIFVVADDRWRALAVQSDDVFFTLETAIRASSKRWRLGYVTAEWKPRRAGRSKVFNPRTITRNVIELFRFRLRLWLG